MASIKIMSDNLANKIAAGEVVEKCSSVVKELVENSIDAGSNNIIIELNDGGLGGIKVIDDGRGMNHDDALLCFMRHATSKLINEDDLFFINTLGFRGEAIPSIASVSLFDLQTCSSDVGSHIVYRGGELVTDEVGSSRKGTVISVKNLFFNTPARLKYLKSATSELRYIVELIEKLAFAYPKISFTLINDEKTVVKTTGSGNLLKTINEVYGATVCKNMIELKVSNDDFDVSGYICKPEVLKSNKNHMTTFVNNRLVKNYDIFKAINDGYYTYKPDIKYPIVVLNIEMDPTLVDVNIHPTKQDVKIGKINELQDLIRTKIDKLLKDNLLINSAVKNLIEEDPAFSVSLNYEMPVNNDFVINEDPESFNQEVKVEDQLTFDLGVDVAENETVINEELKSLKLYPVGLCLGTYIVAQNDEGIYLLDQHAVQERINYERYFKALKEHQNFKISSMFPITIELNKTEFLAIMDNIDYLKEIGFTIEEFGINTVIVKEHPTWLKEGYEEEQIRMILDLVAVQMKDFDPIKFNEHVAITLACKTSIKANYHISHEEMEELLDELVQCENPYNCPHGRPTIIKFTQYDLEKMFKRVMN